MSAPENVAMDTKQALDTAVANAPADLEKAAIAGAEAPGVPEYGGQAGDMSWTKAEERSVLRKVDLAIVSAARDCHCLGGVVCLVRSLGA